MHLWWEPKNFLKQNKKRYFDCMCLCSIVKKGTKVPVLSPRKVPHGFINPCGMGLIVDPNDSAKVIIYTPLHDHSINPYYQPTPLLSTLAIHSRTNTASQSSLHIPTNSPSPPTLSTYYHHLPFPAVDTSADAFYSRQFERIARVVAPSLLKGMYTHLQMQ